jgi:hypothetical protein
MKNKKIFHSVSSHWMIEKIITYYSNLELSFLRRKRQIIPTP